MDLYVFLGKNTPRLFERFFGPWNFRTNFRFLIFLLCWWFVLCHKSTHYYCVVRALGHELVCWWFVIRSQIHILFLCCSCFRSWACYLSSPVVLLMFEEFRSSYVFYYVNVLFFFSFLVYYSSPSFNYFIARTVREC